MQKKKVLTIWVMTILDYLITPKLTLEAIRTIISVNNFLNELHIYTIL